MASILNADDGVVSGSAGLKSTADSSGVLALQTNGTTAVTVTAAGSVGVGTTSPKWDLAFSGYAGRLVDLNNNTADLPSVLAITSIGTAIGARSIISFQNLSQTAGTARMVQIQGERTNASTTALDADFVVNVSKTGTLTEALRVQSTGNVGIGTSSPGARLQVVSSASSGVYGAIIYNQSATGQGLTVRGGSTSSQDAFNVQTYDGNTSLLTVQGGGNVGIGTSSPGSKLDVNGDLKVSPNTAGKNTFSLTTNASNDGRLLIKSNTTDKVDIQANGTSYFEGGTVRFISTISVGNSTPSTSGAGLTFPVTQSASSDANTLDDYEEGGWTPVVSDASNGGNLATLDSESTNATYTKIGNMVYWRFSVVLTSKASMTAGETVFIQGFPFTSVGIGGNWYNPNATIIRNITFTGYVQFHQASSTTYGYFRENVSGAVGDNIIVSDLTNSAAMQASGFYRVSGA